MEPRPPDDFVKNLKDVKKEYGYVSKIITLSMPIMANLAGLYGTMHLLSPAIASQRTFAGIYISTLGISFAATILAFYLSWRNQDSSVPLHWNMVVISIGVGQLVASQLDRGSYGHCSGSHVVLVATCVVAAINAFGIGGLCLAIGTGGLTGWWLFRLYKPFM